MVQADVQITMQLRGETPELSSDADVARQAARLMWISDAFAAQFLYRLATRLRQAGVPLVPRLLDRGSVMLAQVTISPEAVVQPGLYLLHGQVVIDGPVRIGSGAVIAPWVTIARRDGIGPAPVLGANVQIGTGAQIVGPVAVGSGASIGANAQVETDVAPRSTVVGVPARAVGGPPTGSERLR